MKKMFSFKHFFYIYFYCKDLEFGIKKNMSITKDKNPFSMACDIRFYNSTVSTYNDFFCFPKDKIEALY